MTHVLIPVLIVAVALVGQFSVQRIVARRYSYQCGRCGRTFDLTPLQATVAPHRMGGSKFARCPHCRRWSWVSPVPK